MVDADTGTAYAWLAVGRLSPEVVPWPSVDPSQLSRQAEDAAGLVQSLKLAAMEPDLIQVLNSPTAGLTAAAAAAQALVALHPNDRLAALATLIMDPALPEFLRPQILSVFSERDAKTIGDVLIEVMRSAPYRVQVKLALGLAGSPGGAEALLQVVEQGKASPQLLVERSVKDKVIAAKPEHAAERLQQLTLGVHPASQEIQKLIEDHIAGFPHAPASAAAGAEVFKKNCAVCHQVDGEGALIGPQLDGIGNRGLERVVEDVLDPSRNVDRAFRTHILTLKDGDVISGLPRREEGAVLVLADSTGKETSVPLKDIEERRESELSLMPENFGEVIPTEDFNNLVAFLLSKNGREH